MKISQLYAILLFNVLLTATSASAAEREKGRPGFGDRGAFLENLSPETKEAFRVLYTEMRGAGGDLQRQSSKLREELQSLVLSGEVDEKAIRAKVAAMLEVETELTLIRARAVAKLKASGASDETLRMITSRMGGTGQPAFDARRPGMRGQESDSNLSRSGRRPTTGDDRKAGRPEFEF